MDNEYVAICSKCKCSYSGENLFWVIPIDSISVPGSIGFGSLFQGSEYICKNCYDSIGNFEEEKQCNSSDVPEGQMTIDDFIN